MSKENDMTMPQAIEASKNLSTEDILLYAGLLLRKNFIQIEQNEANREKIQTYGIAFSYLAGASKYLKNQIIDNIHMCEINTMLRNIFWEDKENKNE